MEIKHLHHKHGGRITAIHSVGHSTYKGVAEWFYIGDVDWGDGKPSVGKPIMPWAVCHDMGDQEGSKEYGIVSDKLNEYLKKHGRWHDTKWVRDLAVRWTPKKKEFALAL